jgi:hypothetical protein
MRDLFEQMKSLISSKKKESKRKTIAKNNKRSHKLEPNTKIKKRGNPQQAPLQKKYCLSFKEKTLYFREET